MNNESDAASEAAAAVDIGEIVHYHQREYRLVGIDPHGVVPRSVYLEDVQTGKRVSVRLEAVVRDRHLRLVDDDSTGEHG